MFPLNLNVPKYKESWLVTLVDKAVATKEQWNKYGYKFAYFANVYLLFLINSIKQTTISSFFMLKYSYVLIT